MIPDWVEEKGIITAKDYLKEGVDSGRRKSFFYAALLPICLLLRKQKVNYVAESEESLN